MLVLLHCPVYLFVNYILQGQLAIEGKNNCLSLISTELLIIVYLVLASVA